MHWKRAWIWLSVALLLCLAPAMAGADGLRGYIKGQGWKYVHFGEYPYEKNGKVAPVLWRVLEYKDDQLLMITEQVIDTQQVIFESDQRKIERYEYRRITCYQESDLCTWMNTAALDTLLEKDPIRSALIEEPGRGKFFILNMDEFRNPDYGFNPNTWGEQPSRQATGTSYAVKKRGLYVDKDNGKVSYWAADIKDEEAYRLALVGFDGHLSWGGYARDNVGIRPSVRLDMSQLEIYDGTGTKRDPFVFVLKGSEPYVREKPTATPKPTKTPKPTATPKPTKTPAKAAAKATPTVAVTRAPAPTPAPNSEGEVLISFVGNVSIGDSAQYANYDSSYHTAIDEHGYAWPFSLVEEYLAADDLTVANLEVVLTDRYAHSDKTYNLVGDPDHVDVLTEGGIEVVNTANDHCMDYYRTGYQDTLDTLTEAGVGHFGSMYTYQENGFDYLEVRDVEGIRIGFMGFSIPTASDEKRIANRITQLKEQDGCDLVVVSLHWGKTQEYPDATQVACAKTVIDAGADVIYGHHSNVIQPIHFYKGKPIMYSTGNFTYGTTARGGAATGIFQLAYVKVDGQVTLTRLQVIPCSTQSSPDFRPYVLTDEKERREVFKKLQMKRDYGRCEKLPESFLETGVVCFQNGEMLQ